MKKKILFIGPIGDFGGRELETGFMAKSLSNDFDIEILSTGNLTLNSQIFDFVPTEIVQTLNECIYKNSFRFRILSYLSHIKSNHKKDKYSFVSNTLAKRLGYRDFVLNQLKNKINNCDIIVLCMQLTSNYLKEIVEYSHGLQKPTVLRTSTTIKESDITEKDWLKEIALFIHHSESNAKKLEFIENYNYSLIDQCTFKEEEMLQIKSVETFKNLLYVGRISEEKGIVDFVELFNRLETDLTLKIVGDGEQMKELRVKSESNKNIELLGFLNQDEIVKQFEDAHAVVIPSYEESGPFVGLEAMASARIIISTKVGAMPERLNGLKNQFWFNISDSNSLIKVLGDIKKLSNQQIKNIAEENRLRYLDNYQMDKIESQYKNAIFKL